MNTLSFSEVLHSYVTENPKKEIQKVETFKQREKAELNLSVTKLKTKEIEGKLVNGKLVFDITDKKDIQEGNILVTQGTPYKPNNARVRSANSTQILESNKKANRLEVAGENLQDVYVNLLDSKGQLAGIYKNKSKIYKGQTKNLDLYVNFEIDDEYDGNPIYGVDLGWRGEHYRTSTNKGIKYQGTNGDSYYFYDSLITKNYPLKTTTTYIGEYYIEGKMVFQASKRSDGGTDNYGFPYNHIQRNPMYVKYSDNEIDVEFIPDRDYQWKLKINKFPSKDFSIVTKIYGRYHIKGENAGGTGLDAEGVETNIVRYNFKYIVKTLKGNSTLTFAEYYPVNEFVQFTANPTIQNAQPLGLDNSVRDVTLETTGKGLVAMQQGDKLTVDGHEVVIGAGGNKGPQKLTIGNVKYTYEVKNGKFRIALNEWGVLEPNRTIPIKIVRTENGKDKSLAEHNLTIKAPRRVEGTSNVKLNQDYSIRNTIRFNGISLQGAGALGLENPIPLGVSLTSTAGQGIPFMKEGDRLEISDGLTTRSTYSTRGVKAFTIGPNGTLGKQQVKLNNGELTVFVEGGKLRVGVNNWLVNNTINSNVRLVRGTNEIMNHTLDIKVPEAPFNVKKNGLLDFGNVTAGSKRTAETDIVLEMLQDVSDVKFSLKDPQPMLENLGTGDNLKVNRIEYLVSKQSKRDYKVKLKGNLTIPEGTKSGLYTGSTVLELKIK